MEHFYAADKYPQALEKKITLLKYFRSYMNEHLIKTGANIPIREGDELARLPCLNTWFRTKSAIVLHLSNGTLQINFFYVSFKFFLDLRTFFGFADFLRFADKYILRTFFVPFNSGWKNWGFTESNRTDN